MTTSPRSGITSRAHTYLRQLEAAVGDWVIYYEQAATTERYAHVRDSLAQRVVASVGAKLASARKRGQGEG